MAGGEDKNSSAIAKCSQELNLSNIWNVNQASRKFQDKTGICPYLTHACELVTPFWITARVTWLADFETVRTIVKGP